MHLRVPSGANEPAREYPGSSFRPQARRSGGFDLTLSDYRAFDARGVAMAVKKMGRGQEE